jgi:hypothetical protein
MLTMMKVVYIASAIYKVSSHESNAAEGTANAINSQVLQIWNESAYKLNSLLEEGKKSLDDRKVPILTFNQINGVLDGNISGDKRGNHSTPTVNPADPQSSKPSQEDGFAAIEQNPVQQIDNTTTSYGTSSSTLGDADQFGAFNEEDAMSTDEDEVTY